MKTDTLDYLLQMAIQLEQIARANGHDKLAYYFSLAALQASDELPLGKRRRKKR